MRGPASVIPVSVTKAVVMLTVSLELRQPQISTADKNNIKTLSFMLQKNDTIRDDALKNRP